MTHAWVVGEWLTGREAGMVGGAEARSRPRVRGRGPRARSCWRLRGARAAAFNPGLLIAAALQMTAVAPARGASAVDSADAGPPAAAARANRPDTPRPPSVLALHDIPSEVTVLAFIRPGGERLRFLARVPLEAMRDFDFPVRGPGYLDIAAARPLLADAARLWIADYVRFYEDGRPLDGPRLVATRLSLPSDRSFGSYETAEAHVLGPSLPDGAEIVREQALLDVLLEYPIASDSARFTIDSDLSHLGVRTVTVLRFLPPGGTERVFQYVGDPGVVRLDPRWHQALLRFVSLGFEHILDGIDHLLFLLCLVIPFRSLRGLVPVITSFTVAHSITLIASALGLAPGALWFPPFIEALIALSIVYMALENIVGARLHRRWALAFGFGLVHGFGFSFALRETLQFAGSHLLTSLLAFNVGVELGQLFIVILAIPVLELLFRKVVAERVGTIILSAILAHTGWHWMTDRGSVLLEYEIRWPALDLGLAVALIRWTMLAIIVGGAGWLLHRGFRAWLAESPPPDPARARGGRGWGARAG